MNDVTPWLITCPRCSKKIFKGQPTLICNYCKYSADDNWSSFVVGGYRVYIFEKQNETHITTVPESDFIKLPFQLKPNADLETIEKYLVLL